jgi:hypothetical protein
MLKRGTKSKMGTTGYERHHTEMRKSMRRK